MTAEKDRNNGCKSFPAIKLLSQESIRKTNVCKHTSTILNMWRHVDFNPVMHDIYIYISINATDHVF